MNSLSNSKSETRRRLRRSALNTLAWTLAPVLSTAATVSACSSENTGSPEASTQTASEAVTATPHSTPWLVVLCSATDSVTSNGQDVNYYTSLFGAAGGIEDFWKQQSSGHVDMSSTVVTQQWNNTGKTMSAILAESSQQRIQDCVNTQQGKYNFDSFFNFVAVYNFQSFTGTYEHTQIGSRSMHAVLIDSQAAPRSIAHETGHGFSLDHSFNDQGGEYGDYYDVMSVQNVYSYPSRWCVTGGDKCFAGPGLDMWSRWKLGWADPSRRHMTWAPPSAPLPFLESVHLAARNHPEVAGPQVAYIPANSNTMYTAEWIAKDGFEAGLPGSSLVIHRIDRGNPAPQLVLEAGGVQTDTTHPFIDSVNGVQIQLASCDSLIPTATCGAGTATSATINISARDRGPNFAGPSQTWVPNTFHGTHGDYTADVDGDGKADLVGIGDGYVGVQLSTGSSFGAYKTWVNGSFYGSHGTFVGDVTGDGKADLVGLGDGYIGVMPSTGTSFGPYQTWLGGSFYGTHGTFLADVTGDGKADLVGLGDGYIGVMPSTGTGFGAYQTWSSATFYGTHGTFLADVTGDGKADLVGLGDGYIGVMPSTGTGFGAYQTWWGGSFYGSHGTLLADVTGDGKADLVGLGDGYIGVLPSMGTSFGTPANYETWSSITFNSTYTSLLADVTGDGLADLVGTNAGKVSVLPAAMSFYHGE